jgi:hypothetical protein
LKERSRKKKRRLQNTLRKLRKSILNKLADLIGGGKRRRNK